ncbi:MAG: hypothetical protein FWC41_00445 [Firmicutes bacterium]|nr:hypothetical protein [Bacillota bacterium]
MTLTNIAKITNFKKRGIRSERELVENLAHISNIASIQGDRNAYITYDIAKWYIATGRISGTASRHIRENFLEFCKWLNKAKRKSQKEIGDYMHSYNDRG